MRVDIIVKKILTYSGYLFMLIFTILFFHILRWVVNYFFSEHLDVEPIHYFINYIFIASLIVLLCVGYLFAKENVLKLFIVYSTAVLIIELVFYYVESTGAPGDWGTPLFVAILFYCIDPVILDLSDMTSVLSVTGAFLFASITLSIIFAINNRKHQKIKALAGEQSNASNEEKAD